MGLWKLCSKAASARRIGARAMATNGAAAAAAATASPRRRHVLTIQSHVVHGYVGNKSAVFPLQLLGFEVDAVNSVQFCCHTGYPRFGGQVLDGAQLTDLVEGLDANGLLAEPSHLLTGYIGSATFLRTVIALIGTLRQRAAACNPPRTVTYVCDPVLGDDGKLYVPAELVQIYRDEVLPHASLLTPNQFEVEQLTGIAVASEADAVAACDALHARGVPRVALTTLFYPGPGTIGMMFSERIDDRSNGSGAAPAADASPAPPAPSWRSEQYMLEVPQLEGLFTGTGDLTAALLLAWLDATPREPGAALERVGATTAAVLRRTLRERRARTITATGKDGAPHTVVVPPEIALIRSKRDIESPPPTLDGDGADGGAAPVARVLRLRGVVRGVIFDLDGTLTAPGLIDFAAMRSRSGCPEGVELIAHLHSLPPGSRERAAMDAVLEDEESKAFAPGRFRLRTSCVETLRWLAEERGLPLALVTRNSRASADAFLRAAGLPADTFSHVMARDWDGGPGKPHPASALHICAEWGLAPSAVLFVGDSVEDGRCGAAAGCVTVAALPEPCDDGCAAADGAPHAPHWADDRQLAHFAITSLAGLRRLVH